jgi:hypothetical protein
MLHDGVAIELHHLARHDAEIAAVGELVDKARAGHAELDLEAVAIQGAAALDLAVVVEGFLGGHQGLAQFGQAEDLGVLQQIEIAALPARVVVALDGIDEVLRHQLALAALEGRVVAEVDAWLDLEGDCLEVLADLGHAVGDIGAQPGRAGGVVVLQGGIEDGGDDHAGIEVGHLHGVEAGLGDLEGIAQDLLRLGRKKGRGQQQSD